MGESILQCKFWFHKIKALSKSNFTKYFLSYFILLIFCFAGFFMIIRSQVANIHTQNIIEKRKYSLSIIAEQFNHQVNTLDQVANDVLNDSEILFDYNNPGGWYQYTVVNNINKYVIGNDFTDSIIYVDESRNILYSSGKYVKPKNDGTYAIYNGKTYDDFPIKEYLKKQKSQLIYHNGLLYYLPQQSPESKRFVFFLISNRYLQSMLKGGLVNDIHSLAFIDKNKKIIAGIDENNLTIPSTPITSSNDTVKTFHDGTLLVDSSLKDNILLVAGNVSNELVKSINDTIKQTLLFGFFLLLLGLLIIFFGMKQTYFPLRKLINKVIPNSSNQSGYIKQLDATFNTFKLENDELNKKNLYYRTSIQKSILSSLITNSSQTYLAENFNIDDFFIENTSNNGGAFFVLLIKNKFTVKQLFEDSLFDFMIEYSSNNTSCALLSEQENLAVILIHDKLLNNHQLTDLVYRLETYSAHTGTKLSLSDSFKSPLDIPFQYKNVLTLSQVWDKKRFVSWNIDESLIAPAEKTKKYPYEKITQLSALLEAHNFDGVRQSISEFEVMLNESNKLDIPLPDFFSRSVILDIVSSIVNSLEVYGIDSKKYSSYYHEILSYCKNFLYADKHLQIVNNLYKIIDIYEEDYTSNSIHPDKIISIVDENYTSPDFSMDALAGYFNISTSYMSSIFKKEIGCNFSDFLWDKRVTKAQNLLTNSDLTIEKISEEVGYLNVTSFRRKFKQKTGKTPSQVRQEKNSQL